MTPKEWREKVIEIWGTAILDEFHFKPPEEGEGRPVKKEKPEDDGATCTKCKEHNPYAAPSAKYVCYRCR